MTDTPKPDNISVLKKWIDDRLAVAKKIHDSYFHRIPIEDEETPQERHDRIMDDGTAWTG